MTETRKQSNYREEIINLIEPYMEKSLSEGCLVESEGQIKMIIDEYGYLYDNGGEDWNYNIILDESTDIKRGKIYGHYDITSVLKYINKNDNYIVINITHTHIFIKRDYSSTSVLIGQLPIKPLSLYSEEEERSLFELLKKLG